MDNKQIFASADNASVKASTNVTDANTLAGKDLTAAKTALKGTVDIYIVIGIAEYNAKHGADGKAIDVSKLTGIVVNDDIWGLTAADDELCTFAEEIAADDHYADLLADTTLANHSNLIDMDAKYQGTEGTLGNGITTLAAVKATGRYSEQELALISAP